MKTSTIFETTDPKVLLSTLWIFVMFNYLYCDLMSLMDSTLLRQYLTGRVGDLVINEPFLLAAAVLMEIPIAMILLSRILHHRTNRLTNIAAGSLKTLVMVATLFMEPTMYYWFFGIIEIACTSFIVWYAWRWKVTQ